MAECRSISFDFDYLSSNRFFSIPVDKGEFFFICSVGRCLFLLYEVRDWTAYTFVLNRLQYYFVIVVVVGVVVVVVGIGIVIVLCVSYSTPSHSNPHPSLALSRPLQVYWGCMCVVGALGTMFFFCFALACPLSKIISIGFARFLARWPYVMYATHSTC